MRFSFSGLTFAPHWSSRSAASALNWLSEELFRPWCLACNGSPAFLPRRTGSRKGEVHRLFDTKGPEAAEKWGLAQGLQKGSLKSWFGAWRREDGKASGKSDAPKPAPRKP
jgi:hypothetical protein